MREASGLKTYKMRAQGTDSASVSHSAFAAIFFAPAASPRAAIGEIAGMLAAASPYARDTGRLTRVTAHPEYMP